MKEFHPIANLFPLMQGDELNALALDIQQNGLREAIWLHPDGRIIDGRNRYRACQSVGIQPRFRTWDGNGSLVSFVVSLNLHRRHLSSGQRAALAAKVLPMLEVEARKRQATSGPGVYGGKPLVEIFPQAVETGKARNHAAELFNTNPRYVQDAKKLQQEAPDLFEKVRSGKITIQKAKKKMVKRKREAEWETLQSDPITLKNKWPESIKLLTGDFANLSTPAFYLVRAIW